MSEENLWSADENQHQPTDEKEIERSKEEETLDGITNEEITTVSSETNAVLPSVSVDENGALSHNSVVVSAGVNIKPIDTEFMEMKTDLKSEADVECVASFRLDVENISRLSVIPFHPTLAWVCSNQDVRLVDIDKGKVLRAYRMDVPISFLNAIDESRFLFMFNNEILDFWIDTSDRCNTDTFLAFPSDNTSNKRRIDAVTLSISIFVCCTISWKCACIKREGVFIEKYDAQSKLVQSGNVLHKGKRLICNVYDIAVSGNEDVFLAGEKTQHKGEYWVVVLDKNFNFRFSYDRNTSSQVHIPSILATDLSNNMVVVNTFRDRIKRKEANRTIKKRKDLTYIAVVDENGIFRLHLPTDFHNDGTVKFVEIDKNGKAWMITDTGQIIVSIFKDLSKRVEQVEV